MEQNNTAALNDSAGVLPMDTGATVNGNHDEGENIPSSSSNNSGAKKGRGRPPKSVGSTKASNKSDAPKRARGRPAKIGETSPTKKVVVVSKPKKVEVATNGDASQKKRGRPSKSNVSNEKVNGISKPQVQTTPIAIPQEKENIINEEAKKKRGRPSGTTPKKVVVAVTPSAPAKEASPVRKRGRPSGTVGVKKAAPKPKVIKTTDGSIKKRGRPKKSAAPSKETIVATPPVNETATVTPNNVQ